MAGGPREQYSTPDFPKWTRPKAWCPNCSRDVRAVYVAKPGPRRAMRYGAQYTYRCPQVSCRGAVVHPYCLPAAAAIDWTLPAQRIGDRTRPLQPKTLVRITAGLTRHAQALLVPVEGRDGKQAGTLAAPLRAQIARAQDALVVPLRNHGIARPATTHPLVTFAAGGTHQGLIMRNNTARGDQGQMTTRTDEPLRAITTAGHQSLIRCDHLLLPYDGRTLRPIDRPLPAQTAIQGDALLRPHVEVADCTFRMLAVDEIRAGMAFTPGYRMYGAKRERVRMLGNAVTPPTARDLMAAVVEAVTGDSIEVPA